MVEIANVVSSPLEAGDKAIINRAGVPAAVEFFPLLADKQPLSITLTNTTASFTLADESKLDGIEAGAQVNLDLMDGNPLVIENRTSDPGSPAVGQIWLRTDL